mmetsp:Transcript_11435/g.31661  ORF Transcript_11435/g.31661 Transcript_11435/m.31661 type:complete len:153 (-) Transcript_11435:271-729(-)
MHLSNLDDRKNFDPGVVSESNEETLIMDKDLMVALDQMKRNMEMGGDPSRDNFTPALTAVAEGSCNLVGGTVSFIGTKRDAQGYLVDYALYAICIQAKDFFSSSLNNNGVRQNKDRVYHKHVDLPFGEGLRALCDVQAGEVTDRIAGAENRG